MQSSGWPLHGRRQPLMSLASHLPSSQSYILRQRMGASMGQSSPLGQEPRPQSMSPSHNSKVRGQSTFTHGMAHSSPSSQSFGVTGHSLPLTHGGPWLHSSSSSLQGSPVGRATPGSQLLSFVHGLKLMLRSQSAFVQRGASMAACVVLGSGQGTLTAFPPAPPVPAERAAPPS